MQSWKWRIRYGLLQVVSTCFPLKFSLLDRLTHHVNVLEMNGDSYRLSESKKRQPVKSSSDHTQCSKPLIIQFITRGGVKKTSPLGSKWYTIAPPLTLIPSIVKNPDRFCVQIKVSDFLPWNAASISYTNDNYTMIRHYQEASDEAVRA